MKAYRASILYELDQYDKCLGNLFRHADVTFGEDGMCHLVLEDTIVARRYEEQLCSILEKIFTDRCGVDFRMTVGYNSEDPSVPGNSDDAEGGGDAAGSRSPSEDAGCRTCRSSGEWRSCSYR